MENSPFCLIRCTENLQPFGIAVKLAASDAGIPIPAFTIYLGETSYQILERVCRYAAYLLYEDETGALVLDRVGTNKMASGFTMPGNIEGASSTLSIQDRFSDYAVVFSTIGEYRHSRMLGFALSAITMNFCSSQ